MRCFAELTHTHIVSLCQPAFLIGFDWCQTRLDPKHMQPPQHQCTARINPPTHSLPLENNCGKLKQQKF